MWFLFILTSHTFHFSIADKYHIINSKSNSNNLSLFTTKFFSDCFSGYSVETVIVKDSRIPLDHYQQWSNNIINIFEFNILQQMRNIKIENKYQIENNDVKFKVRPAGKFYLTGFELPSFEIAMHELKQSIWWNVYGFFFIQKAYVYNSCKDTYHYLKIMWKFNVLSAIYLCMDMDFDIQVYTFNPYNNIVPGPWTHVKSYVQDNSHPLTIFKRSLNDSNHCSYFYFNKIVTLSGYPISICILPSFYDSDVKGPYKIRGISKFILNALWSGLNCFVKVDVIQGSSQVDIKGNPIGTTLHILNGSCDMCGVFDYQRNFWHSELNTYIQSGMCYVTNIKVSTINDFFPALLSFYDFLNYICSSVVVISLAAFLLKQSIITILMEIIRATVGIPMLQNPRNSFRRFTLVQIVIFFMMLNSYLQSKFTSLLVLQPQDKIEQAEDLLTFGYRLYATNYTRQYFRSSKIYEHINIINNVDTCLDKMKYDSKMSYADDCMFLRYSAKSINEFKTSIDVYMKQYFVYLFPTDYPLLPRIRNIYYKLYESGIIKLFRNLNDVKLKKFHNEEKSRHISLQEMKPIFKLLILSLNIATIVFLFEVLVPLLYNIVQS